MIKGSTSANDMFMHVKDSDSTPKLYMGKVKVRLFSDEGPESGFTISDPEIEDLYFATINNFEI